MFQQDVNLEELLDDERYNVFAGRGEDRERHYYDFRNIGEVYNFHKQKKEKYIPILEMTAKEIQAGADKARIARSKSKNIKCFYQGVTRNKGLIKFIVTSQYIIGKKYVVYIKMKEAADMKYFREFRKKDIIRLFLTGDLQVNCNCADFKYRMRYQAWQMGYSLYKELRYPHIANPNLTGTVCKHILATFRVLQFNAQRIQRDMVKTPYFKRNIEDR